MKYVDTLREIIDQLEKLKLTHPELDVWNSRIESKQYDYDDGSYVCVEYQTYETSEEAAIREKKAFELKQWRENHERQQYEVLKVKFGEKK